MCMFCTATECIGPRVATISLTTVSGSSMQPAQDGQKKSVLVMHQLSMDDQATNCKFKIKSEPAGERKSLCGSKLHTEAC